jgi:hypothetical protein
MGKLVSYASAIVCAQRILYHLQITIVKCEPNGRSAAHLDLAEADLCLYRLMETLSTYNFGSGWQALQVYSYGYSISGGT